MRRVYLWCAVALTAGGLLGPAGAETQTTSMEHVLAELQRLRRRVEAMEGLHQDDQRRIADLESRLAAYEDGAALEVSPWAEAPVRDEGSVAPGGGLGQGNLLNPAITGFADFGGSVSTDGADKGHNRFNFREVEFDLRGAITPYADGVLILAIGEELETDPMSGAIDEIGTEVDIEEGYIDFHTLPYDLAAKAGRFRAAFGPNNLLHTHDLPQVSRPLAVEAFLGGEGLISEGAGASWLVPNPWARFVELTAQVFNSDGGEESPILNDPNADNPAFLAHLKLFEDVGPTTSIEFGGSYLHGHTGDRGDQEAHVAGLDLMVKWLDPNAPDTRSLLFQSELFWAENDIVDEATGLTTQNGSHGLYAFGQYQFARNWYAGLRYDYTEFPNDEFRGRDDRDWALSPYLTWYLNEFLRVRAEWRHREGDVSGGRDDDEDTFMLQFTYVIGAHPPHPYWVNR